MSKKSSGFRILAANLPNVSLPSTAIAASRAGHLGVLDLEYFRIAADSGPARDAVRRLAKAARGDWGVKLLARELAPLLADEPGALEDASAVILADAHAETLDQTLALLCQGAPRAERLVEVVDHDLVRAAETAGADGLVVKGHEAGGRVGDETILLLTQRIAAMTGLPLIAHGGGGPFGAAALRVAGASGALLDWQLALFEEAETPEVLAAAIARMDGSETRCLGAEIGAPHRVFWQFNRAALQLGERESKLSAAELAEALRAAVDPAYPAGSIWLTGQDAAFARPLRAAHRRMAGALNAVRDAADQHLRAACETHPLAAGSALAQAHGTLYPIVQGPMTRVSDNPAFAAAVGREGALPFLALALMQRPEAEELMAETRGRMGGRPWGVGILGFVDDALREEQMSAIAAARPNYALIAGGRPEQSAALEREGIPTYLHVPSPGLLRLFLESGSRRFIFEGRECGGHVGPRTSAILWQQAVEVLLEHFGTDGPIDCDVLFAGGIHDERSGAVVAALAAPIAARGARVGVLMGTAYVLTEEAVSTGAIVEDYQSLVLEATDTVLLESGPGHVTRVVRSPMVAEFRAEKARLLASDTDPEEVRQRLERLNVGRLRIASKGIDRNPDYRQGQEVERYRSIDAAEQRERGIYMIGQAAGLQHERSTIAELHRAVSVGSAEVLDAMANEAAALAKPRHTAAKPMQIAITGIGALLPKARDAAAFWQNILDKVDAIEEIPERRWDWRRYFDENRDAPDSIYSIWGGFLDEIEFDPVRYGIPPNSVPQIEPLQLLALEAVRQAVVSAGFENGVIEDAELRRRTSVIIGVGGGTGPLGQRYAVRSSMPAVLGNLPEVAAERLPEWSEDSFPGVLLNVIAGRIANRFDLGGVNFTVDAACGSSLAAVLAAARELESGTSDMVIVGGADSFQNPFDFVAFSKTRALSPRGRCRTFDASADGIAISEGLAVMVLRRLADAEAAGDRIYAIIQGIAGSSDGRDLSLTAPRPEGQEAALRRAYERSGISPGTIGAVEAHGTGTVVGDRTEIGSLTKVFAAAGADRQFCGLGSVKSMIGHTKAAAGCAGMLKMALALHHKVLPATLHVEQPNPEADLPNSPFHVMTEARPWIANGAPRRAAVSAFGFGGTNFHAVLEEYDGGYLARHREPLRRCWKDELYAFSAEGVDALVAALRRASEALAEAQGSLAAADVAASLARRFDPAAPARFTIVAGSLAELAGRLAAAASAVAAGGKDLRSIDPKGAWFSAGSPIAPEAVAFLFPGQGSQYPGMLADAAMHFAEVRETFEAAQHTLSGRLPKALGELVFPRPTVSADEAAEQAEALKQTDAAQPAIGAASLALLKLLRGLGLDGHHLAGHSFGEFTALHAAGAMDEETLIDLANRRGAAMVRACGDDPGAMLAISADAAKVREVLEGVPNVTLANLNAPDQTVVAGPTSAMEAAKARLAEVDLAAKRLPVACGFHSPCVAPAGELLAEALEAARLDAPDRPVYANSSATPYPANPEAVRGGLCEHMVSPVNFLGTIEAMHAAGARLFLEVGPGAVLSGLVGRCLSGRHHLALPSDVKGRSGVRQLLCLLGGASAAGIPLRLDRLWEGRAERDLDVETWQVGDAAASRSPTLWLVDAANARKPDSEPPRKGFAARLEEDSTPMAASSRLAPPAAVNIAPPPEPILPAGGRATSAPPASATPGPDLASASELDEALRRHQELMGRFIDSNREVMLAWMGQRGRAGGTLTQAGAGPTAAAPAIASAPATSAPAATPPEPPRAEAQVAPPTPAASGSDPAEGLGSVAEIAVSRDAVMEALLALISERTGYPTEMLDPDINLEADLGIDSIKRVEILGALRMRFLAEAGEAARERMGPVSRERTAAGMVDRFMEVTSAVSGADASEAAADAVTAPAVVAAREAPEAASDAGPAEVPRFVMIPRAIDPSPVREWVVPDGVYVLTDDGEGVATRLAEEITSRGGRAHLLDESGPDLADDEALRAAVADVRERAAGLIHCRPLRPMPAFAEAEAEEWSAEVERQTRGFFTLLSTLGPAIVARPGSVVLSASAAGGAFGFDGGLPGQSAAAGPAGLLKTLAKEWDGTHCRAVDFDPRSTAAERAALLADEAGRRDFEVEIGWIRGQRMALIAEARPPESEGPSNLELGPESVVLVTGGARGITAKVVERLAGSSRSQFVLLGSSPEPAPEEDAGTAGITDPHALKAALIAAASTGGIRPEPAEIESRFRSLMKAREIRTAIAAVEAAGGSVEYRACDVRDGAAFGALIEDVYSRYGRIDVAIHGAGLIEDKLVLEKGIDSFDRVLQTKAESAFTLARHLRPESLAGLAFFTSVAGRFGNRGQGDYAAANEIVSKLARELDGAWPARVVAISWGPWDSAGMVSAEIRAQFERLGIDPIDPAGGVAAFELELSRGLKGEPEVVWGLGPWKEDERRFASRRPEDAKSEAAE